jgi:hypothetical protein
VYRQLTIIYLLSFSESWLSLVMVIRIQFQEDNFLLVLVQSLQLFSLLRFQHSGKNRLYKQIVDCLYYQACVLEYIVLYNSVHKLQCLQIKRLYLLLTVKESAMDVPTNLEARRRIAFFTNSLFMDMPRAPRVRKMLSFRLFSYRNLFIILQNCCSI